MFEKKKKKNTVRWCQSFLTHHKNPNSINTQRKQSMRPHPYTIHAPPTFSLCSLLLHGLICILEPDWLFQLMTSQHSFACSAMTELNSSLD